MRNLFNRDGSILRFITKIVYSVYLNLLWFVCCIPIITIGPATTALFYTSQKIVRDEEGYLTSTFFRSFKENFRQAFIIGLIQLVVGVFIVFDGYALIRLCKTSPFWAVVTAIFIVAVAAYLLVFMWVYPLLANFENTTVAMFKNAVLLGMRFLICSAVMAAIYFAMLVLIINVCTPLIVFGMGTCALLNSFLLKNILIQCEVKAAI